jgi:hypothetical protein
MPIEADADFCTRNDKSFNRSIDEVTDDQGHG